MVNRFGVRWTLSLLTILFAVAFPGGRAADETVDRQVEAFLKQPLAQKLDSPRHTLETLCFAIDAYDRIPTLIADATACLGLEPDNEREPGTVELLAFQLAEILDELSIPFHTLVGRPKSEKVVFYQEEGVYIALARGEDGLWRFDRQTVERIPTMQRLMAARSKSRRAAASQLGAGWADPTATMVAFLAHAAAGDYESASLHLDVGNLPTEQRRRLRSYLAWKLACVMQRLNYLYSQDVPIDPDGLPYTWCVTPNGRIAVERVRQPNGKDAWLFSRATVAAIESLWRQVAKGPPDVRYLVLRKVVPPPPDAPPAGPVAPTAGKPDSVPDAFASPRNMLQAFFRAVDEAEYDDAMQKQAYSFLDLSYYANEDLPFIGPKRVAMLETILRKLRPDLATVSDHWSAIPQVLRGPSGLSVEIVRHADGCWRFSRETVASLPAMYESIGGQDKAKSERMDGLGTPRETVVSFLTAVNQNDDARAARCLDLSQLPPSARDNLGPVLAFKLKYVLDRLGRVYFQEIPNSADGPHVVLYRGPVGRIVIGQRAEAGTGKVWGFTAATVRRIESMFERVLDQPVDPHLASSNHVRLTPDFVSEPGVWLRVHMPSPLRQAHLGLNDYQWLGVLLAVALAWAASRLARIVALGVLHKAFRLEKGDEDVLRHKLRSLRALVFLLTLYKLAEWIDLPSPIAAHLYLVQKLLLTAVLTWAGFQWADLAQLLHQRRVSRTAYRGLGELLVPFTAAAVKAAVVLISATYLVYQFGHGETLTRFLTGLGIVGLGVSLAAQDSLKNIFGTLLLIGDRSFRIGDRLLVGDKEGTVEQVGFRSTKLRTPEDSLLVLPNGLLANGVIDNLGLRVFRRIRLPFCAALNTPLERVQTLRNGLRDYLTTHPRIDAERVYVHLQRIAESGIELEIWCYVEVADLEGEKQAREEMLCEVLRQAAALNVELVLAKK